MAEWFQYSLSCKISFLILFGNVDLISMSNHADVYPHALKVVSRQWKQNRETIADQFQTKIAEIILQLLNCLLSSSCLRHYDSNTWNHSVNKTLELLNLLWPYIWAKKSFLVISFPRVFVYKSVRRTLWCTQQNFFLFYVHIYIGRKTKQKNIP